MDESSSVIGCLNDVAAGCLSDNGWSYRGVGGRRVSIPLWKDWKMAARSQHAHRFSGAEDADLVGWVNNSVQSANALP